MGVTSPVPAQTDATASSAGLDAADWVQAGAVLVLGVLLAVLAAWLVRRSVRRYNEMIAKLAGRVAGATIIVVALIYGLSAIGVAVGPLLGALGVTGFAVAFALQDILRNLLAGVLIQVRRPFEIGHLVVLNDHLGRVRDVTLRTVIMDAVDGEQVIIPCHDVISNAIENWSANDNQRRSAVVIGVPYDADLDAIIGELIEAMRDVEGALAGREPMVVVDEFGGSSVNLRLLVWHDVEATHFLEFRSRVAIAAKRCVNDNGLTVPFPTTTLDVPDGSPLLANDVPTPSA